VARDLALISVNALDQASAMYSKVKEVSTSFSEDVHEQSELDKSNILKSDDPEIKKGK
jgi:hypothetical protein